MAADLGVEGSRIIGPLWDGAARAKLPVAVAVNPPETPAFPDDVPEPVPSAAALAEVWLPTDIPLSPPPARTSDAFFALGKAESNELSTNESKPTG